MPSTPAWAVRDGRSARANTSYLVRTLERGHLRVAIVWLTLLGTSGGFAWAQGAGNDAGTDASAPDAGADASTGDRQGQRESASADEPPRASTSTSRADDSRPSVDAKTPPVYQTTVVGQPPPAAAHEDGTAAVSVLSPRTGARVVDDLGTLLLEVPGANVTRRGSLGALTTVSLRGSNPDEVRIYVDGIPVNEAVGGAVDLSTLPLGDVERVEVYRGSSPLAFGTSALGGIISITTQTPRRSQASARVGGGSFRTSFADFTAGGGTERLKAYVGLHALRAVGDFPYASPSVPGGYQPGVRENNDLAQLDGVARASLTLPGRRELRAGILAVWRDQGLAATAIYRAIAARASTARALAHLTYDSRDDLGAGGRLRAALYSSAIWEEFSDPLHEIVGVPIQTLDRTRALGARVTAEKSFSTAFRLMALAEARAEEYLPRNEANPTMPAGYPASRRSATAGLELASRIAPINLDVVPSARVELSRDLRTGRSAYGMDLPPSPPVTRALPILRLGLLRPLGAKTALRGNVGRYARVPSFVELYGWNRGVLGNPRLRPERGVNADLGVSLNHVAPASVVTASATVFGALVEDLIAWQIYGSQTIAENISSARIWGVELEARWRLRRLALTTQATLTDARDTGPIAASNGKQLAHHPRYRAYARAEWREPVAHGALVVSGYADGDAIAGNYWTANGPLPNRVLLGAGAGLAHPRSGLALRVTAANVTDSRVQDFPGYPLPGRTFFATLEWSGAAASGSTLPTSSSSNP